MDAILLSWVTTVYLLASASILVPVGKIADIYGRKRIFTYGILAFTVASLGSGISNSAMMLIFFRTLQGIRSAAIYSIGTAILTSVFPSSELGKVWNKFGCRLFRVFRWAILRRISNALSRLEKYFFCKCSFGIGHNFIRLDEIKERMATGK